MNVSYYQWKRFPNCRYRDRLWIMFPVKSLEMFDNVSNLLNHLSSIPFTCTDESSQSHIIYFSNNPLKRGKKRNFFFCQLKENCIKLFLPVFGCCGYVLLAIVGLVLFLCYRIISKEISIDVASGCDQIRRHWHVYSV